MIVETLNYWSCQRDLVHGLFMSHAVVEGRRVIWSK
jgi:hypothetical protein